MFLTPTFCAEPSNLNVVADGMGRQLHGASVQQMVNTARYDDYARAGLTLALLSHMSLDPLSGNRLEDFVDMMPSADGMVGVYLSFYQVANFVGSFVISRSSSEWSELQQAIGQNIDSRMFKAAAMHVRMREKYHSRIRVLEGRARAVHQKALDDALAIRNPQPAGRWVRPSDAVLDECYVLAHSAKQAGLIAPRQRLDFRMESVRQQAYRPDYRGSFYEMQTAFAAKYMASQNQATGTTLQ
jgi:hypothetical protein